LREARMSRTRSSGPARLLASGARCMNFEP
jgi:hypothetical protein